MWMLLRAPKMKSAIFGFQRLRLVAKMHASLKQLTHREIG